MLEKLTTGSLLTLENIRTIIEAERPLQTRTDTLIVQFASGLRLRKQAKVVWGIHDYREAAGWDLAEKFGPIQELIVVGRLGTHTLTDINLRRFPFCQIIYRPVALMLSGWNAEQSHFAFAEQHCDLDEDDNEIWDVPCLSIATAHCKRGLRSPLEDIYSGANAYTERDK